MGTLNNRVVRLENQNGLTILRPGHMVFAVAGNQTSAEIATSIKAVMAERGIEGTDNDMFIVLHGVDRLDEGRPVYEDQPIQVSQIDGVWLR